MSKERPRLYCAVWSEEDGAKVWAGDCLTLPRTGEFLTFENRRRYRVVRVEHGLDFPNKEEIQGVDVYVVPEEDW